MRTPALAALVLATAASLQAADKYPASGGDIMITTGLHASVQLEYGATVVQIDPWSAAELSGHKKASLILITDDPAHHMDPKAIAALRRPGAPEHPKGEASGYLVTLGGPSLLRGRHRARAGGAGAERHRRQRPTMRTA